jgi:hypothetical protein
MNHRPGATVPATGVYWCSVCKLPAAFTKGEEFPECKNMCGRGLWQRVETREDSQQ